MHSEVTKPNFTSLPAARSARRTSMPVISGMFQSESTRSGFSAVAMSSACLAVRGLDQVVVAEPAWRNVRTTICRITRLSSAMRIFMRSSSFMSLRLCHMEMVTGSPSQRP